MKLSARNALWKVHVELLFVDACGIDLFLHVELIYFFL